MKRVHAMPFGAYRSADGGGTFRLWAPGARRVDLVLGEAPDTLERPMDALPDGWFALRVDAAVVRPRYAYRIDGGAVVPDPASRSNPDDVHAASALVDPLAYDWPDGAWRGRPWHEAVIYELHVGCFTPEGTFRAAVDRLDDLVALGVTAIELMPVADFPGRRGWGYDGVLPYAPDAGYGTPDDLKALVAAAHARGLMVLLDVVYNHFGPDGNYLGLYADAFFDPAIHTPWGPAIAFDAAHGRTVRDFFVHNALYWIEEYHVDGLRLDAVHAIRDKSVPHVVDELAQAVRDGPGLDRHVHLVLENEDNDARRLERDASGRPALADAQWNDDVHHALHVMVTGETDGYYVDFADAPLERLGRALAEGFAYQGEPSTYRHGAPRGTRSDHLPPLAFVNATQNHDQVGNRAFGERIATLAEAAGRGDALRAAVACVLLSPSPPMLFMGEEWGAATPFLYFCDHAGELAQAVTQGRRAEFSRFARFCDPAVRDRIPDPNAQATFAASRLDWSERERPVHAGWLALYRRLLAMRREHLVPLLPHAGSGRFEQPEPGCLHVVWPLGAKGHWHLCANLSGADATLGCRLPADARAAVGGVSAGTLAPWSVAVAWGPP